MPLSQQLESALAGRYTIERELGGGGMSRVFLGTETALDRRVVVKVLSPDVAHELSAERFEREIRVAAQLQHPNIVPVLAAGIADGMPFYTMPYVDGESLRVRLASGEPLPFDFTLGILRDVARALAYAHSRGVVHRDIKPENILLSGDAVVVTDFGIAKALTAATVTPPGGARSDALTRLGTAIGTPAYMAPEQAIGDPAMDHRADLYSWGIVAHEMLSGRHPFAHRTTPQALVTAHLTEPPPALGDLAAAHPWLASLVMHALAKNREDRPATARQIVAALTTGSVGEAPIVGKATPSVAVLPFANVGGQSDDEYFSDGMTEEAINAIGRIPGVRVAARTSSFAFKGQRLDLRTIAQQLRVETILEGSVRRAGTRVRIAVQLVSAADGFHLWSERFDRELSDIFALQDEIGSAIAGALRERFGSTALATPPERTIRGAVDPTAYDHYLRGRFLFEQHAPLDALQSFERAVAIDPGFALAHAWSGSAVIFAANLGLMPPSVAYPRGKKESELLLALDPSVAEGHLLGAICALWYDWDYRKGERLARRAVELSPNDPHAHEFVAWSLLAQQRAAEGIASMEKSYSLDPMSEFRLHTLCLTYSLAGMQDRAIELLRPALARSPGNGYLHWTLGVAFLTRGLPAEARVEYERARELMTITNFPAAGLACALAALGEMDGAARMLDEARALAEAGRGAKSEVAVAYHWLGDDERALAWFEQAVEAKEMFATLLALDPRVTRLRETPAFQRFLEARVP